MYPRRAVGSRDSSPLRLWSDNPTSIDLLGFADIAALILEAICRERLDPVAVGIFGDWGSGKTTVLEILRRSSVRSRTRSWSIHARGSTTRRWMRGRLWITEVLDALHTRAKKDETLWDTTKEKFAGLARRIKWSKAITLASRSAVTFTLPSVESLVEIFGDKPEVPNLAAEDVALAGELAPVLFEKLDGNPRRLKRFLNAFWVLALYPR